MANAAIISEFFDVLVASVLLVVFQASVPEYEVTVRFSAADPVSHVCSLKQQR